LILACTAPPMNNQPKPELSRKPTIHFGIFVLALIVLSVFGSLGLARFGYTSILPAMQQGLALTNTQTGILQSLNLIGYMIAVVFAGMLASRFGPRIVISVSLLIVGLSMLFTGLIPHFGAACFGRFFAGVGGAGGNVPAMGLVSAWFSARRRGLATGIGVTGSSIGLIVTGPMIPVILNRYGSRGWQVSWYVLGGITVLVAVVCALFLRNHPREKNLRPIGENGTEKAPQTDAAGFDWKQIIKSRVLWQLAAIYCAFGFSYIIYSTFFVRHLVSDGLFTSDSAGTLWMQIGLVSMASGFVWGSISDHWGRTFSLLCVFTLQGISFSIFGLSETATIIYLSAALFAVTSWSIPALMAALAGDVFGSRLAPAALGLMTIVFGTGQALGPYLAGVVADSTNSFSSAFILAGGVALIFGAGGTLLLRKTQKNL